MERVEAGSWTVVGPVICNTTNRPLTMIPADTSVTLGWGWSQSGPEPIVPDFAQPGTYRLRVLLYLDSKGNNGLPEDFAISNSFTIASN